MNLEQEIKSLIDSDKAQFGIQYYHPTQLKQGGRYTKKALDFNRRMIRAGKTTNYLDRTKLYNLDSDRVIAKPVDKRYKDGRLRTKFKNDHDIQGSVFTKKKSTIVKSYTFVAPVAEDLGDDDLGITTLKWQQYDGKDDLKQF